MPMRFFCLLLLLVPASLLAQPPFPNICLDPGQGGGYPPCEPSLAISRQNPAYMVAGAILDKVYTSQDSGRSWQIERLQSPYGVFGDPCLVADSRGNFHYLHLSNPSGRGWESEELLDRIVIQRSADQGKSWTKGSFVGLRPPRDQDKEWAAAHPSKRDLYVSWTEFDEYESRDSADRSRILFARSTNGGKSWKPAVVLSEQTGNCLDDDGTTEGAVPAVGPDGQVYVAWALNEKIYFDHSDERGKRWQAQDQVIATQPGGWVFDIPGIFRCNGLPVTACDLSEGPHRGTVYVHWADQRNGTGDTDLWLIRSEDEGQTWSEPLRINDDAPGKQQFLSWLTVDPVSGFLYCVFYDRRAYEDNRTDVYLAYSRDGGRSFTNLKISEAPFTPDDRFFFGDYCHIDAYNGIIRPIWTRMVNGRSSVWTALIQENELP